MSQVGMLGRCLSTNSFFGGSQGPISQAEGPATPALTARKLQHSTVCATEVAVLVTMVTEVRYSSRMCLVRSNLCVHPTLWRIQPAKQTDTKGARHCSISYNHSHRTLDLITTTWAPTGSSAVPPPPSWLTPTHETATTGYKNLQASVKPNERESVTNAVYLQRLFFLFLFFFFSGMTLARSWCVVGRAYNDQRLQYLYQPHQQHGHRWHDPSP